MKTVSNQCFPYSLSGLDVCPMKVYSDFEQHVTGDIAFAVKQYVMMTEDRDFLREGGADLVDDIAKFWESRAIFNTTTNRYEIYGNAKLKHCFWFWLE